MKKHIVTAKELNDDFDRIIKKVECPEVFIVEEYEWYSGGSGISLYDTEEAAMAALKAATKGKGWKMNDSPNYGIPLPTLLIEYQNQWKSKSALLWRLPIQVEFSGKIICQFTPASPSAASSASSSSQPDGASTRR